MAEETKGTGTAQTEQGGNDGTGNGTSSEKTFTQSELDSIVGKSKQKAKESALKAFFEEKGVSAEEAESAISEFLKNKKPPAAPESNNAELQSQLDAANKARVQAVIEQKATVEAIKLNVVPENVTYVLKLADFSDVVKDGGEIDDEKLTAALSKVLDDVPALKKAPDTKGGFRQIGGDGKGNADGKEGQQKPIPRKPWNKWNHS